MDWDWKKVPEKLELVCQRQKFYAVLYAAIVTQDEVHDSSWRDTML